MPRAFIGTLNVTKKLNLAKVTAVEVLVDCLTQLQNLRPCSGISLPRHLQSDQKSITSENSGDRLFSKNCDMVGPNVVCIQCKLLSTRIGRNDVPKTPKEVAPSKLQKGNKYYRRRIRRLVVKQKNIKVELLELRSAIKNLDATKLKRKLEGLQSLEVDHGTRLTLLEIIKAAKASSAKGNRYSSNFK